MAEPEAAFATLDGRRYCVAFNSCGAALAASPMAVGACRGGRVLINAFTMAPVPGAIVHAGAEPVSPTNAPGPEVQALT